MPTDSPSAVDRLLAATGRVENRRHVRRVSRTSGNCPARWMSGSGTTGERRRRFEARRHRPGPGLPEERGFRQSAGRERDVLRRRVEKARRRVPVTERQHRTLARVESPIGSMEKVPGHQVTEKLSRQGGTRLELRRHGRHLPPVRARIQKGAHERRRFDDVARGVVVKDDRRAAPIAHEVRRAPDANPPETFGHYL